MHEAVRGRIGDHKLSKLLGRRYSGCDVDRAGRFAEHAQRDLRGRAVVGLSEELAAPIEHSDGRAWSCLPSVGYIGAEDPGMPQAKAVDALSGYTYFRFQFNMVADSSNTTVSSIVVI